MNFDDQAPRWRAAEFFAGIGLARVGLSGGGIDVVWSNDISESKHSMFSRNFGEENDHKFVLGDLGSVSRDQLPDDVDFAWASFPCTDLSVAGGRAGLHRGRASSTFWHFIKALSAMGNDRPRVIALENVVAFASSHSGRDIVSAIRSLNGLGYSVDILNIDARHFLPQSRPRLFLTGVMNPRPQGPQENLALRPSSLRPIFADTTLRTHQYHLPELPPLREAGLADHVEPMDDDDPRWWGNDRVRAFEMSLSELQHARYELLRARGTSSVRTAYRRMRRGVPRWELRADEVAGCLRTSSGGSSKQAIVIFGSGRTQIRWMTPREYASLMGVPNFPLAGVRAGHAYSGFGDAVCAPVVQWLAEHYFEPVLSEGSAAAYKQLIVNAQIAS